MFKKARKMEFKKLLKLDEIISDSFKNQIFIYKHSESCPLSARAKYYVEAIFTKNSNFAVYQVNVLSEKKMSTKISQVFEIKHESPQLLLIKNGKAEKVLNHYDISSDKIAQLLEKSE